MTRLVVTVPKSLHGKVIGKGAATKKDIESDYNVRLTFPAREDETNGDIIVDGDSEACKNAEARILDICGMAKNNGVEGAWDVIQRLRREKDDLFKRAYAAPKGRERDELFRQANEAKQRLDDAEEGAADEIFKTKNRGYGDEQMDLHGQSVEAAEKFVNQRLDKVQKRFGKNDGFQLEIITGIGNHSENNVAKIKPAISDLLRSRGFDYRMDDTGGIIVVTGLSGAAPVNYPSSSAGQPAQPSSGGHKPTNQEEPFEAFLQSIFEMIACCFGGGNTNKRRQ